LIVQAEPRIAGPPLIFLVVRLTPAHGLRFIQ
jgi:hypothetical protein